MIAGTLTEGRFKRELEGLHLEAGQLLQGLEKVSGGLLTAAAELSRLNRSLEGPIRNRLDQLTRLIRRLQEHEPQPATGAGEGTPVSQLSELSD